MLSTGWAYWVVPAVMIAVYARAARNEEAKFAGSHLAVDYAAYRSRTGVLKRLRTSMRVRTGP